MNKIVHLGRGRYGEVFCRIEVKDGGLSICGVEGPKKNGDASGGCGQIEDSIELQEHEYAPGWDAEKVDAFLGVWRRWHLNDMRAGCEHQRAEGWNQRPIDPSKPLNAYGRHFDGQKQDSWNMLAWVRADEHPEGLLCRPCPICGYKYGSAWLKEELPVEVVTYLEGLPVTDVQPAWV